MPTRASSEILPPLNWQDFEALCRDLFRELWHDPATQRHGRSGQPQNGVDVFGRPGEGTEWAGVQCKLRSQIQGSRLTRAEIEAEVEKAKGFEPALTSFTIATTALQDAGAQAAAREITARQLARGSFSVALKAWEEIAQDLAGHPEVLATHYPELRAAGESREAYLREFFSQLLPVPLIGRGAGSHREDVPLSAVYTALDVEAEGGVGVIGGGAGIGKGPFILADFGGEERYLESLLARLEAEAAAASKKRRDPDSQEHYRRRLTALEAAAAAPRLVLLGPAGSGKSSFARHLALCLAGEALGWSEADLEKLNGEIAAGEPGMAAWPHGAPLPLFIELRKLVRSPAWRGAETPGAREILTYLAEAHPGLEELAPRALGRRGGALLILDGLDETPAAATSRRRLKAAIASLVRAYPEGRVLVTSRPYAYREQAWRLDALGFEDAQLAPLAKEQSQAFIAGWYAHLAKRGQVDPSRAEARAGELWRQIERAPYLLPLAELPLMLTLITDLHASGGGRLRGGRAGIYERSVELLLDRWNEARDLLEGGTVAEQLGMSVEEIRRALERLAFDVHRQRGSECGEQPAEITDAELWRALGRERSRERVVDERRVMDYLHQRSGILLGESPERYRFPHRSYQEYLAAGHLIRTGFPDRLGEVVREDPALWREVVQLAAGQVAELAPFMFWTLLETLVPEAPAGAVAADDPRFERALLAALVLKETAAWRRAGAAEKRRLEPVRTWLEHTLSTGALPPAERAEAGRVLGLLGDRRPGVGLTPGGLPDIDWIEVPAGEFLMGSPEGDEQAFRREMPQHAVEIASFEISRYPVTNAQFAAFVEAGGYAQENRNLWTDKGWGWKKDRQGPDDELPEEFLLANHPRVGVSWHEACAFCRWLGEQLAQAIRLPSEEQWEKAARGTDGQRYPWGEDFDSEKCNAEMGLGLPSPVGMFPSGASPYGVLDAAGNVDEWTRSVWTSEDSQQAGGSGSAPEVEVEGGAGRVFRGGSWSAHARLVRAAFRDWLPPVERGDFLGFRLSRGQVTRSV